MARIPAAERRDALIGAALRVVASKGVAAATTRAIVAEAGMSLASFHYAFESRDELMAGLVAFVTENEQAAIVPESLGDGTLRDILRSGLARYFSLLCADPEREKAMFELAHYAMRTPGLEHLARRQYEGYRALATFALEAAAAASGTRFSHPIELVANLLVVYTDGITLTWLASRDDEAAEFTLDRAADALSALAEPA